MTRQYGQMAGIDRRSFLSGAFAAFGGLILPVDAFGEPGTPLVRIGVASDVHIDSIPDAIGLWAKALAWFDREKVDVVMVPGDIAHSGVIASHERFAAEYDRVFPNGRGSDGRPVERVFMTGNHDIGGWGGRWKKHSPEEQRLARFDFEDNPKKTWERLYHEEWKLISKKTVKGITFVSAQYQSLNPPIKEFFSQHAKTFDPALPFFYTQHAHPTGTCHGSYCSVHDHGLTGETLSRFPNAVAITGHTHCSLTDERTVWQGAFTSIGAGCLAGGVELKSAYANAGASYRRDCKCAMRPMTEKSSLCSNALLIDVYADHLIVRRRSVHFEEDLGEAWCVPLPAAKAGPMDFARRAAQRTAPAFAADAVVRAEYLPKGHALASRRLKGKPVVAVSFPPARSVRGCRVFDYQLSATADGKKVAATGLWPKGFAVPESRVSSLGDEICLFDAADLPRGVSIVFSVVPRECFGASGKPLRSAPCVLPC